jgi:hypothetical protein
MMPPVADFTADCTHDFARAQDVSVYTHSGGVLVVWDLCVVCACPTCRYILPPRKFDCVAHDHCQILYFGGTQVVNGKISSGDLVSFLLVWIAVLLTGACCM